MTTTVRIRLRTGPLIFVHWRSTYHASTQGDTRTPARFIDAFGIDDYYIRLSSVGNTWAFKSTTHQATRII